MLRLIRGVIYGVAAGLAAAFVLDYLDKEKTARVSSSPRQLAGPKAEAARDPSVELSDDARKALLDELGAQL